MFQADDFMRHMKQHCTDSKQSQRQQVPSFLLTANGKQLDMQGPSHHKVNAATCRRQLLSRPPC